MKHKHKFLPYREIEIPTGKWILGERGLGVTEETETHLILYCSLCGKVTIKELKKGDR